MEELKRQSFEDFLNAIAARTPTPGGGAVAASTGALACAMGRMVIAYSAKAKTPEADRAAIEAVLDNLRHIDERLRDSILLDADAYRTMTVAANQFEKSSAAYQETVLAAIAVPMDIAALSSQSLEILDEFKNRSSRYLRSDLGVSAVLAEATARAAAYSVWVNLPELADAARAKELKQEISTMLGECHKRHDSITAFVDAALQP